MEDVTVKKRMYRIVVAGAAVFLAGCASYRGIPVQGRADYATYGNAPFPFWCHLTKTEIDALLQADSARAGNADALLSLAIFASGDARDSAAYAVFRSRVQAFVARTRPGVDAIENHKEKGRALYAALCGEFYGKGFQKGTISEYRPEQSRLTELLRSKKYDCISSALLCSIIFRYFGLKVSCVFLAEHVFVQYDPVAGERIEIETTNIDGYDFRHDDRYFKENPSMAIALKLTPVTRQDYADRQIVSPFQAVIKNLHSQHLKSGRMTTADQDRLYEARGYLDPDDTTAAGERLAVYNNECNRFDSTRDHGAALAMFDKVGPVIIPLLARWRNAPAVMETLGLVWSGWTVQLAKGGRTAAAIDKLDTLAALVDKRHDNCRVLSQNVAFTLQKIAIEYTAQERYPEVKAAYERCRKKLADSTLMENAYHQFYETMGTAFFKKKTYPRAIACYDTALCYAKKPEDKTRIYDNIQAAYYNMSLTGPQPKKPLRECVEKYPMCTKCRQWLNSMP